MKEIDLKKAGLSSTQPRRLILELFQQNAEAHMCAEDVYRKLQEKGESVGIATVYRVLSQFDAAGLLLRHQFDGTTSVYELNLGKHHDHLICNACGKVTEFVDEDIERLQQKVAEKLGFSIDSHLLYIFGHCNSKDCGKKDDS
jgi:Fur family ferric uptake transcriptional regulator